MAEEYLKYLYSPEGQAIIAEELLSSHRPQGDAGRPWLKPVKMFTVDDVFGGWQQAQREHFSDGGIVRPDFQDREWSG